MSNRLSEFRADDRGAAVVEFALMTPFLLLLFSGLTEYGRAYFQANAIEKGLRAATLYAARAESPLSAADTTIAENILKTGTIDGSGDYLVGGWGEAGAGYSITTTDFDLDGTAIPVIRMQATVPLDPLVPELLSFVGLGDYTIKLSHEQAYVGL
ncbi:MAG: TadE/TadG family type IV pilus assembly protein [Alphaproteobacteria bacterium]